MKRFVTAAIAIVAFVFQAGLAHAAIRTEWVDYKQGDVPLRGYLAYDDSLTGKRPGILLVYYRGGFSDITLNDAQMIARLGYVVFAEDMFGAGVLPKTVPEMQKLTGIYDSDRPLMRARSRAGYDVLKANPRVDASKIAVIGYCFGGLVGLELAETGVPMTGLVTVHGSFRDLAPGAAKNIKGRMLILHGAEDPVAPLAEVNKLIGDLRANKVPFELNLYSGATHAFTEPKNASEERADSEYKIAIARFFKDIFGS